MPLKLIQESGRWTSPGEFSLSPHAPSLTPPSFSSVLPPPAIILAATISPLSRSVCWPCTMTPSHDHFMTPLALQVIFRRPTKRHGNFDWFSLSLNLNLKTSMPTSSHLSLSVNHLFDMPTPIYSSRCLQRLALRTMYHVVPKSLKNVSPVKKKQSKKKTL